MRSTLCEGVRRREDAACRLYRRRCRRFRSHSSLSRNSFFIAFLSAARSRLVSNAIVRLATKGSAGDERLRRKEWHREKKSGHSSSQTLLISSWERMRGTLRGQWPCLSSD